MKKILYSLIAIVVLSFAAVAQVPNAGFEDWDSLSFVDGQRIYDPVEWLSSNAEMVSIGKSQSIAMSTDAHSGNYAVKITSMIDDGEKQASLLASTRFPLTGRIKYFEAWYKYMPATTDSFRIYLAMYKNGLNYGQAYMISGQPKNEYTKFRWELTYPDNVPAPDSAVFLIQASIFDDSEGSILLIDDMAIGYQSTGTEEPEAAAQVSIYPNPANERITFIGCPPKKVLFIIHNSKGALVKQGTLEGDSLNTKDLEQDMYFIQLNDEDGWKYQTKFMKQ